MISWKQYPPYTKMPWLKPALIWLTDFNIVGWYHYHINTYALERREFIKHHQKHKEKERKSMGVKYRTYCYSHYE